MPESLDVVVLEIPARLADLAFRISVPRDWKSHELPAEDLDFSSPGTFFPLLLAVAPWAAVVLTVAARPGFENGTLQDWSLFLLDSQEIRPTTLAPAAIGTGVQGLAGVGRQQQEGTWLEVRFAFFEDGGCLVYLGLLAPEAISAPLDSVWKAALGSFALERPQGQHVPLGPGMASPEPEQPRLEGPPWGRQAEQLERDDRLEEAEQLLRDKIPSLHCAIQIAELYRRRWIRLRESDPQKAGEARKAAANWAYTYASWATSGGEGTALSLERDEFLRLLGPEPL